MKEKFEPCAIVPVYNHEHAVGKVVDAIVGEGLFCLLIDDGSTAACAEVLDALAAARPDRVGLLRHVLNRGKGAAILTGMREAASRGYSHVLQIDADAQHDTGDLGRFIGLARAQPGHFIIGCPVYDHSVPAIRFYGRYLTHISVWINTLSLEIRDTMCGFRVYPVGPVLELAKQHAIGARMEFETAVLVRLHWAGHRFVNVPTRVTYPADGLSHFRMGRDNLLIARMHVAMLFGMLWRAPWLLARKLRRLGGGS